MKFTHSNYKGYNIMTTYTIGFEREYGDFQVLVTLNNNDELMTPVQFSTLRLRTITQLKNALGDDYEIVCLERQDAPDYIDFEETAE
jgi:hypothetical protein